MRYGADWFRRCFREMSCISSMIPRRKNVSQHKRNCCVIETKSPRRYIGVAGLAIMFGYGKPCKVTLLSKSRDHCGSVILKALYYLLGQYRYRCRYLF